MGLANAGSSIVSPHPTISNLWVRETDSLNSNLILSGYCNGFPDITTNTYSHGCELIQLDSGTTTAAKWVNIGSAASPSWSRVSLPTVTSYQVAEVTLNGLAPVNVFGASGAPCTITLTGVYCSNYGATAAVIGVDNAANTAAFIAKLVNAGTGVMIGATSILSGSYIKGAVCQAYSSVAGDKSPVFLVFTTGAGA